METERGVNIRPQQQPVGPVGPVEPFGTIHSTIVACNPLLSYNVYLAIYSANYSVLDLFVIISCLCTGKEEE